MNGLAFAWLGIIAFGIIMYVLLDGFDLGVGILMPFFQDEHDRDIMVSAILPLWDGNETWLVFGGAALYGAFPLAFSTVLTILYLPILLMVIALLFRGVAFEFRLKAHTSKRFWDDCFFLGSLLATFAQGTILGSFVEGYTLVGGHLTLDFKQWLNPFSILCGGALVFGYALLGSNRLIAKTVGQLQRRCFELSKIIQWVIIIFVVVVSVWSPYLDPQLTARWFNLQYMPYFAILPLITVGLFIAHVYSVSKKHEHLPFWLSVGMFLMCYIGFVISSYPYLVPHYLTYAQAAASPNTLAFMLVGAVIMLPVLLFYTYHSYRIFSGKVTEKIGY